MADIGPHIYNAALLEEVIPKRFKKNQNVRCFNCGKKGHLKGIEGKVFLETIIFFVR